MIRSLTLALGLMLAAPSLAQPSVTPFPAQPVGTLAVAETDFTARDFRFADGKVLPQLKQHYRTLGQPDRNAQGEIINAVMVLHGTGGTGAQFLVPQFAVELFGPGQPLDVARYFIILPDAIGHGASSKPSDGLKMAFPAYDYADMVRAQKLLLDHLKVGKLRLLMGTSMGCMMGFQFGTDYPQMARGIMPLACNTVPLAGRNRLWRQMAIDAIKADPVWNGGNYTPPPLAGLKVGIALQVMASSAPVRMQAMWPTREASDEAAATLMAQGLAASADANDRIFQLEASRNYNPSPLLARIPVPVTWVNSADDFINPPGLGLAERDAAKLPQGRFVLIPESADTRGHSTHTWAKFWKGELTDLLRRSE
ncbi:alpha/beta fold hydrolase [Sandarakinorhabdus sp.]|uniref:alpha/beta fold hydrolase n=1 Tax=Sandarakinorhabdus sp. TaxID=1916663 RepID=UPI00286E9676|nr:alpha/beta fold hydrolase [Sandarakinorhabdus sp.]